MNATPLTDLTDAQILGRLTRLSRCERRVTARIIAHLAEFDRRSLHLGAGFPSLYLYCTEVLRLSEHESYNRIEAARAVQRFPVILERLAAGCLNLTAVRLLAPHLTDANFAVLIAEAEGRGKRGVEEILARHFPKPDVPDSIRKVAARSAGSTPEHAPPAHRDGGPVGEAAPADGEGCPVVEAAASVSVSPEPGSAPIEGSSGNRNPANVPDLCAPPSRPEVVRPLAEDRYEVRFTATRETCEKLKLAKDLLRHRLPNGETAEVIDRALTLLLEDLARKKFATTSRGRLNTEHDTGSESADATLSKSEHAIGPKGGHATRLLPGAIPAPASRHIPAQVKRTVWIRDGGRCAFVSHGGRRCTQQGFLEFHHVRPYAVGGQATAGNIALRCRAHNAYEAELYYGPGVREGAELVPERVGPDGHGRPRMATTSGARESDEWRGQAGRMGSDRRSRTDGAEKLS